VLFPVKQAYEKHRFHNNRCLTQVRINRENHKSTFGWKNSYVGGEMIRIWGLLGKTLNLATNVE